VANFCWPKWYWLALLVTSSDTSVWGQNSFPTSACTFYSSVSIPSSIQSFFQNWSVEKWISRIQPSIMVDLHMYEIDNTLFCLKHCRFPFLWWTDFKIISYYKFLLLENSENLVWLNNEKKLGTNLMEWVHRGKFINGKLRKNIFKV
jgi:hypothetical protein